MIKNSTEPILLQKLFELMESHRPAFGQERIYWRAVGMVLGEVFNFGRHTVRQGRAQTRLAPVPGANRLRLSQRSPLALTQGA